MQVTITDLSRNGTGVARSPDGQVIFVPFTAPGDQAEVEVTEQTKRYAEAELRKLVQPSAMRVKPPCQVFSKCGGCQLQHLPYAEQWAMKLKGVQHTLKRLGIEPQLSWDELPADKIYLYRNRIQLHGFQNELGFYAPKSKTIIPIEECSIARPEINALIPQVREQGKSMRKPYKVEIEVLENGETRTYWNAPHSAGGFRQVHDEQNEKLRAWVASSITPGVELLDLFGGSGNLSLGIAGKMHSVQCVDTGAPEKSEQTAVPENFNFHRSNVLPWLLTKIKVEKHDVFRQAVPRAAILDPPREGLAASAYEIVQALDRLDVTELVLVGCDADAWGKDLHRFLKHGWQLKRIAALDLFPQTRHIESLAYLTKI